MITLLVAATLLVLDTTSTRVSTSPIAVMSAPVDSGITTPTAQLADTATRRPQRRVIELSDWYGRRLAMHRFASWTMLPLFAGEYATGSRLISEGTAAPTWTKRAHPLFADGVLTLFAINTVTGAWNLWDARRSPAGRTWRTVHSVLMLAADAGFTYVGSLSRSAKESGAVRDRHRTYAIASGGVAVLSIAMMLPHIRRD